MSVIADLWKGITERVVTSQRQLPSALAISPSHVINQEAQLSTPFVPDEHYFQVRINEMYLTTSRQWFSSIEPMVFVVSEFTYDKKEQTVPFVVGPAMMQEWGKEVTPKGTIFRDTRVAGLHPYRGGRLTLYVALCQVENDDYARNFLRVIEGAANALDFSTVLGTYVKIAGVVLDGFKTLFGLGGTTPLVGYRYEFDPDDEDPFTPGYFALIDKSNVDPQTLWVRDRQLLSGRSEAEAKPFREADFVLYSVTRPRDGKRTDITLLPFYPLWERVEKEAAVPQQEHYKSAKANMLSLYETILLSPDLTRQQATALADEYAQLMVETHARATRFANMSGKTAAADDGDELGEARSKAVSILDL